MPSDHKNNKTMRLAIFLSLVASAAFSAPIAPVSMTQGDSLLTFESSGQGSWRVHPKGYRAEIRPGTLDIATPSGETVRLTLESADANARAVPSTGQLRYGSVLPGIDLLYYGNRQRLEF